MKDEPKEVEVDAETVEVPAVEATPKRRRGFAAMTTEQRTGIARLGGKAAHAKGSAHRFTSEQGRAAGKKGGEARRGRKERAA